MNPNTYAYKFFCFRCFPGPKINSFQFANLVAFHLRCECKGLFCDMFDDWNEKELFWQSDWGDWSQKNESEVRSTLEFFAKRWLRENNIPEAELPNYLRIEIQLAY